MRPPSAGVAPAVLKAEVLGRELAGASLPLATATLAPRLRALRGPSTGSTVMTVAAPRFPSFALQALGMAVLSRDRGRGRSSSNYETPASGLGSYLSVFGDNPAAILLGCGFLRASSTIR